MSDRDFHQSQNEILGNRYEILRQLAGKGGRKTLLARDNSNGESVVIKLLSFGDDFRWDDLKLFEREAETLKSLSHSSIPRYLDYFEIQSERTKGFALVQSYLDAPSLEEQVKAGRSFSEEEIKQIAKVLLEILGYLHSRQPSVIHRDIKPSNILLTNRSGNTVGDVYLVDFGSVQNLAANKGGTITVVGTYGYMPPEQFGGRATPASDIYSLGATLIYLVTGRHPADLPETDLKLEFEQFANVSPGLIYCLKKMTEPSPSKRFTSTNDVLKVLDNNDVRPDDVEIKFDKPRASKVNVNKSDRLLEITIPPAGLFSSISYINISFLTVFSFLIPLIPRFFSSSKYDPRVLETAGIDYQVFLLELTGYPFAFCLFAGCIIFLARILFGVFGEMTIRIDRKEIALGYKLFGIAFDRLKLIYICYIDRIEKFIKDSHGLSYISLWSGNRKYELLNNSHFPLTNPEVDWLVREISNWLNLPIIDRNQTVSNFNRNSVEQERQNVNIDREDPIFTLNRASSYFEQGDYQNALDCYNLAIELNPKSAIAYCNRSDVRIHLEDYQEAINDCDRAIQINPNLAEAYLSRSDARLKLGDNQKAKEDFNRAIQLNPNLSKEFYDRGFYLASQNRYKGAIAQYNKAIQINPNYDVAYYGRGVAYYYLGDYPNAITNCDRAIQLDSNFFSAYETRAHARCYSGDSQGSLADFIKQVKLAPNSNSFYNLGVMQYFLEMYGEALESFSSVLQFDSKFIFAYYNRAIVRYELGYDREALKDFNQAIKLENNSQKVFYEEGEHGYYARGLARYRIGNNYKGAIKDLEQAAEIALHHQFTGFHQKAIDKIQEIKRN